MLLRKIREREESVCVCERERKRLSLFFVLRYLWVAIWNNERGLLPLGFGFAAWWFSLSWCVATFGFDLCAICILYLVFVNLWFFGFVFVRESYLGLFGFRVCESASTLICIIPNLIQWNLFVVTHGCRQLPNHVNSWCFVSIFFWINFLHSYWLVWRSFSSLKYFHNQTW